MNVTSCRNRRRRVAYQVAVGLLAVSALPGMARAHGETPRGGGSSGIQTMGGQITPGLGGGLRFEFMQYDEFSDQQLLDFAREGEDVHQHSQEFRGFVSGTWAPSSRWAIDVSLPVQVFRNFREGEVDEDGEAHLKVDDRSGGIGDLLARGRYQAVERDSHHLSVLAGIELPTGDTRETDNDGERLGAHNQPGSGSVDFQLGLAYTLTAGPVKLSADVIGHVRTEGATEYRTGNSLQVDLGLSYPTELVTPVLELNGVWSQRDIENDEVLKNSGHRALEISPGVVVTPVPDHAIYASFSYPMWQPLPGIQNEQRFRTSLGYAARFGSGHDGHGDPAHEGNEGSHEDPAHGRHENPAHEGHEHTGSHP